MSLYDDSQPFVGAFALVRRYEGDTEQWLVLEDDERQILRLPEARRTGSSYRDALIEVIEADLSLSRKKHFLTSGHARRHHQAPIEWEDTGAIVWVVVQFIIIDLYGRDAETIIRDSGRTEWLTPEQFHACEQFEGISLCPRQRQLVKRADVVSPI